jgi:hypothetical protein
MKTKRTINKHCGTIYLSAEQLEWINAKKGGCVYVRDLESLNGKRFLVVGHRNDIDKVRI